MALVEPVSVMFTLCLTTFYNTRLTMRLKNTYKYLVISMLATLSILAGCDSDGLPQGGGAGDGDSNSQQLAIALLTPFGGFYELEDGWNGTSGDVAFLVIDAPDNDGTAQASLFDFDEIDNCVPSRPSTGELTRDIIDGRVFMDGILQLDQSVLTLNGSTLIIEFQDLSDINNNGSTQDIVRVQAEALGVASIADLGMPC